MDPLGPIFTTLQANAWIYCLLVGKAPWGMRIPASGSAQFHSARSGSCWIVVDGEEPVELRDGDLAIICRGDEHYVTDDPGSPVSELLDVINPDSADDDRVFGVGDGGCRTDLVCGGFQLVRNGRDPLADLPKLVVIRSGHQSKTLMSLLDTAEHEIANPRLGSAAILSSLGVLVLVETIRVVADDLPAGTTGLLAAIHDDRVAATLSAIHNYPEHPWSLSSLASEANTSKTTLTSQFKKLMGTTISKYLTEWRMTTAASLLERSDLPLPDVAASAGYGSEAAFSRAFSRHHGLPPGAFRRSARDPRTDSVALPPLFHAALAERARVSGSECEWLFDESRNPAKC